MYMMSFTISKLCSLQFSAATSKLGEDSKFQMSTCYWASPQFHHDYPQTLHTNVQEVLLCMTWLNPFQILICPLLMAIPLHNYTLHNLCSSNSVKYSNRPSRCTFLRVPYHTVRQTFKTWSHIMTCTLSFCETVASDHPSAVPSTDSNKNYHHHLYLHYDSARLLHQTTF